MTNLEKCGSCKLYVAPQKSCPLMIPQMQGKIEPYDFCSQHKPDIAICEVCGAGILTPFIETEEDDTVHVYCVNCLNQKRMNS